MNDSMHLLLKFIGDVPSCHVGVRGDKIPGRFLRHLPEFEASKRFLERASLSEYMVSMIVSTL